MNPDDPSPTAAPEADAAPGTDSEDARIVELADVDSTQAEAMRRAVAGERGPLWVRSAVQTQGRGRSGRAWSTPAGNLAATLLFEPRCPPAALPQLSLVAGIAATDAINHFLVCASDATRVRLKWPNDLMIGAAKLGGILVESTRIDGRLVATIGIGVNIAHAPAVPGRAIACLAEKACREPTPRIMLAALGPRMARWIEIWDGGRGFAAIRAAWLERTGLAGEPVQVNAGAGPVKGTFEGLDIDGALLLIDEQGRRQRFTWGDVTAVPAKV